LKKYFENFENLLKIFKKSFEKFEKIFEILGKNL